MTTRTRASATAVLFALLAGSAAADGQLDPGFGGGFGYTLVPFGVGDLPNDQFGSVVVDSAGRILAAGMRTDGTSSEADRDFALARLLPDGSLDPDFGTGGKVRIGFNLGGFQDAVESVYEADDGRYVACGRADTETGTGGVGAFAIARMLTDGTLDTSFDFDGRRSVQVPHPEGGALNTGGYCAPTPDGGIVLVGSVYDEAFTELLVTVIRLLPNGNLDTGFNGTGYQLFDPSADESRLAFATALVVLADGRIVVAGAAHGGSPPLLNLDMFAARLLPDGSLDSTFGEAGVRRIGFDQGGENRDTAAAIVGLPDGGVVLAGTATTTGNGEDVAMVRLQADGSLMTGFGTDGRALFGFDGGGNLNDRAAAMVVDSAGRFYIAGSSEVATDNRHASTLRVTSGGTIDASFAVGGWHLFGIDSSPPAFDTEFADAIALDASERAVVAGGVNIDTASNFEGLVFRLTSDRVFANGFESP